MHLYQRIVLPIRTGRVAQCVQELIAHCEIQNQLESPVIPKKPLKFCNNWMTFSSCI